MSEVKEITHESSSQKPVKCMNCKNLTRIYIESAFALFGMRHVCRVKNTAFDKYDEIMNERECLDFVG
jgi:hypothetical protein